MNFEIKKLSQNEFPQKLLEIPQPPKQLYIKGEIPNWEETKFVTVVGSRKHTHYGKEVCKKIISELKGHNIVIISGLAIGIDTIAHKSALDAKLKTIAVPASGLGDSVIYPRRNKILAEEIVRSGGCLISEFEPDFKPTLWSFPQRNRIMTGLSDIILIIEANEKSGTLITARMGLDYNKEVCVVPASIFSDNSSGSNNLLKQGAAPVTSGEDVLKLLGIDENSSGQRELNLDDHSSEERKIISLLNKPQAREELIQKSGMEVSEFNSLISLMEVKGVVQEIGGEITIK